MADSTAGPATPSLPPPSEGEGLGGGRAQAGEVAAPAQRRSRRGDIWRRLARNELAVAGGLILLLLSISALFAPYLSPEDPLEMNPTLLLQPPSAAHWMGT